MRKILGLVVSLTVIAGVCAAVLAAVNAVTKGPIDEMKVRQANAAALAVMPAGVTAVAEENGVFVGRDAQGGIVGYAVAGCDGGGYGGDVRLMVGFEADRKTVVSYRKLAANETPGLGSKLVSPEFAGQFRGKDASAPLAVKKDGGDIEAITSATITSRAVCRAVADAQSKLR